MRQLMVIPLMFVLMGSSSPPDLSQAAKNRLDAPMPTNDAQRVWECAGTTKAIAGLKVVLEMQGRPADAGGEVWSLEERAKRIGCSQTEMDAPDQGRYSNPPATPRPH